MSSAVKPDPYITFDKRELRYAYLGGDGENCELDAWAEMWGDGWRIYRTGVCLRRFGVAREYLAGRWSTLQETDAAWRRGGLEWDFDQKETR